MRVRIPTPLRSYTGNCAEVEAAGGTVAQVLASLEGLFPGIRFRVIDEQDRIRQHMRIFVNHEPVADLSTAVQPDDEIHILQALSGG